MHTEKIYSVIGIGIGPFNLGMAALIEPVEELTSLFFDQSESFDWHPGLMLNNATLQVPFLADLVTMADPTSKYSFLNFIKESGRLYPFYIRENFFIYRREYNEYCKWVASQLPNCKFSHKVVAINHANDLYEIIVRNTKTSEIATYYSQKIVLGTGTSPYMPDFVDNEAFPNVIHASKYLYYKSHIPKNATVSIIGSGQSAAEIFRDLLPETQNGLQLKWFTRSSHFFPLDNKSKLTLELTSPEYIDHFHSLSDEKRKRLLARQHGLYKGIDQELINEIFDSLYEMSLEDTPLNVELRSNMRLTSVKETVDGSYNLDFVHTELDAPYDDQSNCIILATGYKYKEPAILSGIEAKINRLENGLFNVHRNYTIDKNATDIFVQNAELHTHGLSTPDLGMGAYRNSCIINQLANREVYKVEKRIAFQQFGVQKITKEFTEANVIELVNEPLNH
ncbi:SidA/IucD/PvdA family monooxygenase [Flavobacterium sp. Fl-77]|uniref:SidA/IucD/PvdA family monooxygenase n=1 Tax=Flavobacterium flavipigmentatum TaxID=2893884 RepID=A0AAJ2SA20_9FLAO|nr:MULTISPECIES: SidA/IucD/PvdA family monooxygenase [unclassified Flavobacterium]MDX6182894.1 SidA/IucD/PvdA family monooxygenase [Flavobacterium sp. Fl-33]MDX6186347.1 SidA/IucD/PvdA family monooxygenase [Flavobacterium sp. Fl-77]UFH37865.1 SidA/IucD/PvdA family monooxygenase [Flavobacterium sp. F-70]